MSEVFQSKWGFHVVSKETLKKLRFLNGVYQRALGRAKSWGRWERKLPQNRVCRPRQRNEAGRIVGYGEATPWLEPSLCPVFTMKITERVVVHPTKGYHKDGQDYTHVQVNSHSIVEATRQARTPFASQKDVPMPVLSEQHIEALYSQAKQWVTSLAA